MIRAVELTEAQAHALIKAAEAYYQTIGDKRTVARSLRAAVRTLSHTFDQSVLVEDQRMRNAVTEARRMSTVALRRCEEAKYACEALADAMRQIRATISPTKGG